MTVTEKKKIEVALSDFNKHLEECDVFQKGEMLISFSLMIKYLYLNLLFHTKKNISYIFNN